MPAGSIQSQRTPQGPDSFEHQLKPIQPRGVIDITSLAARNPSSAACTTGSSKLARPLRRDSEAC